MGIRAKLKRLAARFVGFQAGFLPGHYFYSDQILEDLNPSIPEGSKDEKRSFAAIVMAVAICADRAGLEVGSTYTGKFYGVTDRGREQGDYEVTIKKTRAA